MEMLLKTASRVKAISPQKLLRFHFKVGLTLLMAIQKEDMCSSEVWLFPGDTSDILSIRCGFYS